MCDYDVGVLYIFWNRLFIMIMKAWLFWQENISAAFIYQKCQIGIMYLLNTKAISVWSFDRKLPYFFIPFCQICTFLSRFYFYIQLNQPSENPVESVFIYPSRRYSWRMYYYVGLYKVDCHGYKSHTYMIIVQRNAMIA